MVGLFADQDLEEVNDIVADCELDAVQLCGKESVEYTAAMECQVIKVVHVPASYRAPRTCRNWPPERRSTPTRLPGHPGQAGGGYPGRYRPAFRPGRGRVNGPSRRLIILAGGLTPANVGRVISVVRPGRRRLHRRGDHRQEDVGKIRRSSVTPATPTPPSPAWSESRNPIAGISGAGRPRIHHFHSLNDQTPI